MSRESTNFDAPLPLGYVKAIERAAELRRMAPTLMSYATIAIVMREYHGFARSEGWWRSNLRGMGVPPRGDRRGGALFRGGELVRR